MSGARVGLTGVDHCVIAVHDLEAARTRYQRLGFTITPRGRHIGWATANYCIMFPDDYIELLGIVEPGAYCAGLDTALAAQGEGILKLALGSDDASATHAFFAAEHLVPVPVAELARELEAPGGTLLPKFRLVHPDAAATPGLAAFVCEHLTPGLLRRDGWCVHRNSATGIVSYAVVADDPPSLAGGWARVFGADAVVATGDRLAVATGTARLEFLTPAALAREFEGMDIGAPQSGTIAAMTVAVAEPGAADSCLAESGVDCRRSGRGLIVPPQDACGVIVVFEAGE